MLEKKVRVSSYRDVTEEVSAADAVSALAAGLGYSFKNHMWGLTAEGPARPKRIYTEVYRDGEVELIPTFGDPPTVPRSRSFSAEEGVMAIAAALGLEFRAEYVVGESEPQVVAVKKGKK